MNLWDDSSKAIKDGLKTIGFRHHKSVHAVDTETWMLKNLGIRYWVCPNCKSEYDRDENVAINILGKRMEIILQNSVF